MPIYVRQGHVEVAADGKPEETFYLPHHAVSKGRRGETKWRIVFDASSHEKGAPSLNDALEMGPKLLPDLFATLLRFRLPPVATAGDIRQSFLQLQLDEKDRDLTRFFWYRLVREAEDRYFTTDEVICYQFTRLHFGLTCSPFLLSAAVREFAATHTDTFHKAAMLVDRSTYMDDFVACAEDDSDVIAIYYQLTALMRKYSFPMGKWSFNSEPLRDIWKVVGREIEPISQVLGVDWDTNRDILFTDQRDVSDTAGGGPTTNRRQLQVISRFYDPM